jgi:hypothetical protein
MIAATLRAARGRAGLSVAATVAVFAFSVLLATTASAATLFGDDFEDGNANGWSKSGGSWSIVADGSQVYRQGNTTSDLARVFAGSTAWTDYAVQARVRPIAFDGTGTDRFAGIATRVTGSTSFDRLVLLSAGRAELQAVRSGTVSVLASTSLAVTLGTWYTLRVEASGGTIRGFVNGVLVGSGASHASTGRIGLQTFRTSASFDDVAVTDAAAPGPTPSTTPPTSTSTSPPPTNTLIVATNGNDNNPGTLASPLLTIQRAINLAGPGTTILVRGGTYAVTTNIQILKSGTSAQPITLGAFQNETVVVDGEALPASHTPVGGSIARGDRGLIHMEASFWRITGIQLTRGPYGIYCSSCNNNIFDRLVTFNNYETGFQLQDSSANNQILNLDSFLNHDPRKNGESADGLGIKEGSGTGNVVRGARLWNNVDDGFDAFSFTSTLLIDTVVAWGNGFNRWNFPNFAGDGNGFKLGISTSPAIPHTVRNCMAFDNATGGFIDNGNAGTHSVDHNTAWRNGGTGFNFNRSSSVLTKNLSVANATQQSLGSSSTGSGNSWDLGGTWTFVSTDATVIEGPRTATGAIASSNFLRPANGADVGARI